MKAWVVGATGETGRRIVQQLVDRQIEVRVFVRDGDRARSILPSTVDIVTGDLSNPSELKASMAGWDVVLCATGARPSGNPFGPYQVDYEGTKNLVDAAKSTQMKHFVFVSSLCVSRLFHPLNLFWLILVWKQQAEKYLQASGLTYTIVRPGGLRNTEDTAPITMANADTLFEGSISRTQVAKVCIEALTQTGSHNKIVEVVAQPNGVERTFTEMFAGVKAS